MIFRTDLAFEAVTDTEKLTDLDICQQTETHGSLQLTRLQVRSKAAADHLGKPQGTYITAHLPNLSDDERQLTAHAVCLAKELTALLPTDGIVLVVGLGNRTVTPDTLGPATADMVLATRHIRGEFVRTVGLDDLRPTAVITPGVLGQTGTESSEIVRGICREIRPAAVLVVDALAARSIKRLGCTVQLCDTGIAPGSGVGNNRRPLNRDMLGVPVIGMGIPTVVDAATLVQEMTGTAAAAEKTMMVTPREIDLMIARAARLLAMSINGALQPAYSSADLMAIAKGI